MHACTDACRLVHRWMAASFHVAVSWLFPMQVHWFALVNSVLVVVVMATIVAMILIRTIRRDLAK